MKLLVVGSLLTISIVAAGALTMGLMQEDVNQQSEVAQSPSDPVSLNANRSQSEVDTLQSVSASDVSTETNIIVSLYGNENQSGYRIHRAINNLILQGTPLNVAISNVIEGAITNEGSGLLSSEAFTSTKTYKAIAVAFMSNMVTTNDLFAATKSSIENKPDDTNNIIDVSVVLYPDFAQEIINAAVMTGQIDSNQALLAAIAAGADPTTVSEATAAGAPLVAAAGLPVDGIGGGGTGNEDDSASNN